MHCAFGRRAERELHRTQDFLRRRRGTRFPRLQPAGGFGGSDPSGPRTPGEAVLFAAAAPQRLPARRAAAGQKPKPTPARGLPAVRVFLTSLSAFPLMILR